MTYLNAYPRRFIPWQPSIKPYYQDGFSNKSTSFMSSLSIFQAEVTKSGWCEMDRDWDRSKTCRKDRAN